MLQRNLGVSYAEARQLMGLMESHEVVRHVEESKTREVLISTGTLASTVDRLRRDGRDS